MTVLSPERIFTVMLFLGLLGLAWLAVRFSRGAVSAHLSKGRRIRVAEVTALSPSDKAVILQVDDREFLLLKMRGAAPVLAPLSPIMAGVATAPMPEGRA